jgi:hypothetical protein
VRVAGTEAEIMGAFRRVRDQIKNRIEMYLHEDN